jgi:hypothetical protein
MSRACSQQVLVAGRFSATDPRTEVLLWRTAVRETRSTRLRIRLRGPRWRPRQQRRETTTRPTTTSTPPTPSPGSGSTPTSWAAVGPVNRAPPDPSSKRRLAARAIRDLCERISSPTGHSTTTPFDRSSMLPSLASHAVPPAVRRANTRRYGAHRTNSPAPAHTRYNECRRHPPPDPLRTASIYPQGLRCQAGRSLTDASPAPDPSDRSRLRDRRGWCCGAPLSRRSGTPLLALAMRRSLPNPERPG